MYPKLVKNIGEMKAIKSALEEFYFQRPDEYGLEKQHADIFKPYIDLIIRYVKVAGRVLDFGAGTGHSSLEISKKGFTTVGCDLYSEEKLQKYKALFSLNKAELIPYDGSNLPFEPESFDAVASLNVFEHIVFVDKALQEIHRVLKKNGVLIIKSPNWSGLNNPIRAIQSILFKKERYWQYENITDAFFGFFRSFLWYCKSFISKDDDAFVIVQPRLKNGKINFEKSDDDCVHLCQPLSFRKWFKRHNYKILEYNRFRGESTFAKLFNSLFPSFATTNTLVVQKR